MTYVAENFAVFLFSICKSWVFCSEFLPLFNSTVLYLIIELLKFLMVLAGHDGMSQARLHRVL